MTIHWPWAKQKAKLWIDLGDLGDLVHPERPARAVAGPRARPAAHDYAPGRHPDGCRIDAVASWDQLKAQVAGYDIALMNVRSYTFPSRRKAAQVFKEVNHAAWSWRAGYARRLPQTRCSKRPSSTRFARAGRRNVMRGPDRDPAAFPRLFQGQGRGVDGRVAHDRPHPLAAARRPTTAGGASTWPLEPECGWGPGPVVTLLTSRVCPWQCVFCNGALRAKQRWSAVPWMQSPLRS